MRQTYTDDSKHATNYGYQRKKKYNNYIPSDDPVKDEIQRNAVPQGDWGRVETDPTQGRGTRLNNDMRYHLANRYNYTEPVVKNNSKKKYSQAYIKAMKKK